MKKVVCILLAAVMCLAVAGCGASRDGRSAQGNQGKTVSDVLNEKMNESKQNGETSPDQSQTDAASVTQPVDAGSV